VTPRIGIHDFRSLLLSFPENPLLGTVAAVRFQDPARLRFRLLHYPHGFQNLPLLHGSVRLQPFTFIIVFSSLALNFDAMEVVGVSSSRASQLRITDYFHTLHVPLTELESFCPFHQTLITDYYREIELSILVSESYSEGKRFVPVFSESVLQALTSTMSKRSIPSFDSETPVSKFVASDTNLTHVFETPHI